MLEEASEKEITTFFLKTRSIILKMVVEMR